MALCSIPQEVHVRAENPEPYIIDPGTPFTVWARYTTDDSASDCQQVVNFTATINGVSSSFATVDPANEDQWYGRDFTPAGPGSYVISANVVWLNDDDNPTAIDTLTSTTSFTVRVAGDPGVLSIQDHRP